MLSIDIHSSGRDSNDPVGDQEAQSVQKGVWVHVSKREEGYHSIRLLKLGR